MIYYSENTSLALTVGDGVQLDTSGNIAPHTTGECIGFIRALVPLENGNYRAQVYVAGGGGTEMRLGASWDGNLSRFEIVSGAVHPVTSGGQGWLIPTHPKAPVEAGALVYGSIYS